MTGVDALFRGRPSLPATALRGGKVTKVTDGGAVYVTPDGADERHPLGPCLGARYRPAAALDCSDGPHAHPVPPLQPLPRGSRVLLAITGTGPWVISWEEAS